LLAGELGFEPRQTESESVVLPLHHSPSKLLNNNNIFRSFAAKVESFANPAICCAHIAVPVYPV
jgi:hypothetical protein